MEIKPQIYQDLECTFSKIYQAVNPKASDEIADNVHSILLYIAYMGQAYSLSCTSAQYMSPAGSKVDQNVCDCFVVALDV